MRLLSPALGKRPHTSRWKIGRIGGLPQACPILHEYLGQINKGDGGHGVAWKRRNFRSVLTREAETHSHVRVHSLPARNREQSVAARGVCLRPKAENLACVPKGEFPDDLSPIRTRAQKESVRSVSGPKIRPCQIARASSRLCRGQDDDHSPKDGASGSRHRSLPSRAVASTLSMRRSSRSTTSKRHPEKLVASPASGNRPICDRTSPATVS